MRLNNIKSLKPAAFAITALLTLAGCSQSDPATSSAKKAAEIVKQIPANNTVVYRSFQDDKSIQLSAVNHALWQEIDGYQIKLALAPPVHASIGLRHEKSEKSLVASFKVAQDKENIYLRLKWHDDSKNHQHAFERFADSAAIQFAINGKITTSYMMGSPDAPVNIWYWNSAKAQAQNLAAGGFGSLTRLAQQQVSANASYADNEWQVVFKRARQVAGEYQVDLTQDSFDITFAVWQGATKQRDGLKVTSTDWITVTKP